MAVGDGLWFLCGSEGRHTAIASTCQDNGRIFGFYCHFVLTLRLVVDCHPNQFYPLIRRSIEVQAPVVAIMIAVALKAACCKCVVH